MSISIEQCIRRKAYNRLCLHKNDYMLSGLYRAKAREPYMLSIYGVHCGTLTHASLLSKLVMGKKMPKIMV
jgi:hypothetical protein